MLILSSAPSLAQKKQQDGQKAVDAVVEEIGKQTEEALREALRNNPVILEALREVPLRKSPVNIFAKGPQVSSVEPGSTWEAISAQGQLLFTGQSYWVKLRKIGPNDSVEPIEGWAYLGGGGLPANFKIAKTDVD